MNRPANQKPLVTVIMPVFNEEAFIRRGLGAILNQTYPAKSLEIVIADGMSNDRTRAIVEEIADQSEIPIRLIDNPKKIAPAALNRAIENAKGQIIVRVDGHCEIDKDYVENCVRHLTEGDADGVGGPIETIGETRKAKAIAVAMSSVFGVGGSAFRTIDDREMYVDTVAFPGYKKETLDRVGPFREELVRNQDDEYNYRIRKMGGRILLAPDIRSKYYSRGTFRKLWRQYFQYGYWKVRVLQLHPGQMSVRQFVPFLFVLSIILLAFLGIFIQYALWLLIAEIVLYLIANTAATLISGRRSGVLNLPLVSLSYAILHLSYGFGFLVGILKFWRNWFRKTV